MDLLQSSNRIFLVKPKFLVEPTDMQTKLNAPFSVRCKTSGLPIPTTRWEKLSPSGTFIVFQSFDLSFRLLSSESHE